MQSTSVSGRAAISALTFAIGLAAFGSLQAAPIITNPFNFRDHTGPNPIGLPAGDLQQVGAFVSPSGGATHVTATQGATVIALTFTPETIFPNDYESVFAFDPGLTGAWTITATRGGETSTALTSPIATPQIVPLVDNLRIVGTGLTPTLEWEWPDLSGFSGAPLNGIRIIDAATHDQIFTDWLSSVPVGPAGATASITVPSGVLEPGHSYAFREGVYFVNPDGSTMNRSVTFVPDIFTPIPEPATSSLMLLGIASVATFLRAAVRRREGTVPAAGKPLAE